MPRHADCRHLAVYFELKSAEVKRERNAIAIGIGGGWILSWPGNKRDSYLFTKNSASLIIMRQQSATDNLSSTQTDEQRHAAPVPSSVGMSPLSILEREI